MSNRDATPEEIKALEAKALAKGGQKGHLEEGKNFELLKYEERWCTDIFFLIFFFAFWVVMFGIATFGFMYGNPQLLTSGYDFHGKICGMRGTEYAKKPYVYYPYPFPKDAMSGSLDSVDLTWATCVEKCPNQLADADQTMVGVKGVKVFSPPNMCMMPFHVKKDDGVVVLCGGEVNGKTDMAQFGIEGFFGFVKYCMKMKPKCMCTEDETPTTNYTGKLIYQNGWLQSKSECCNPDKVAGQTHSVGAQTWYDYRTGEATKKTGTPMVEIINQTIYPELRQFNIPFGHRYGFCFLPYPSYLPGEGTNSEWSRCIPKFPSNDNPNATGAFQEMLTAAAVDMAVGEEGYIPQPANATSLENGFKAVIKSMSGPRATVQWMVNELQKYRWVIAGCVGIALGMSLLFTFLLKALAGPIIYTLMVGVLISSMGATTILGFKAGYLDPNSLPASVGGYANTKMPAGMTLGPAQTNQEFVIAATVFMGVFTLIYMVLFCVMLPRVSLALKIMNCASTALASMPMTLIFPVLEWIVTVIVLVYWIIVMWFLASAGEFNPLTKQYEWNDQLQGLMIYHVFGLLWTRAWILAIGQLCIAGACADWFLATEKNLVGLAVFKSLGRSLRFHTGTAAFGSFLIAVVQMIRLAFRYYMWQISRLGDKDTNAMIKFLWTLGECCLACLERFLNFINKNAYIQCAIKGSNFISGAKDAFFLLLRNCLRVGTVNIITTIFCYIGKFFIAISTAFIGALWIQSVEGGGIGKGMSNVTSAPVFPVWVILVIAYGIACAFLDVWDMCIDTIFQCHCMDEEYSAQSGYKKKTPGDMQRMMDSKPPPTKKEIMTVSSVVVGGK